MLKSLLLFTGIWRATLTLPEGELPFNFEIKNVQNKTVVEIINGEERIVVDEVSENGDSVFFNILKSYATNPEISYKNAVTEDFKLVAENISGKKVVLQYRLKATLERLK